MGSLFKTNTIAACFLAVVAPLCAPVHAASVYYPAYPQTSASSPQQEEVIKRGEYLAKMGDCLACHTNVEGGTPAFSGGLSFATPFGTFYSPNITPDKETGIGTWTEDDFVRALKEGVDPQGRNYFPVFPFVYFANISDDDARALYAYFMSVPAVRQENKPLAFPFNVPGARTSLIGWKLLFFYPNDHYKYNANETPVWNRGKYIVDGLGHCSMCHTPLNALGSPKENFYLTGGFINGYWAPNITKRGLESATPADVANVFVKNELINKAGPVAGPMAEVDHNSLSHLTEEDRLAIAVYLKTVDSVEPIGLPGSSKPPTLSRGKQVYMSSCILCHQNGQMTAPRLGNSANWFMRLKASGLTGLYRHGIKGYNSMPVKGACVTCSDNDIIASVDYILDKSLTRSQKLAVAKGGSKTFPSSGREVYNENCSVCHNDGQSGAPIIGDKKAWQPLIAKNLDVLVEHTLKSTHHPVKGGCKQCTTGEIIDAIKYIVNQSKTEGNYSLW